LINPISSSLLFFSPFLLSILLLLSPKLSKKLKNSSQICPRAVIALWRRSLLFKIESGAFWGEGMLSGAK
jgi:hypothetical protein